MRQWGSRGTEPGQFQHPTGIAASDVCIAVTDKDNHRVQLFGVDAAATLLRVLGTTNLPGADDAHFNFPYGVCLAKDQVYVSDYWNHRIQVFRVADGELVGTLVGTGHAGNDAGQLNFPTGIFADTSRDCLYVTEFGSKRVTVVSIAAGIEGSLRGRVGGPGKGDGQLSDPTAIAVDTKNALVYVTDYAQHRIQSWTALQ